MTEFPHSMLVAQSRPWRHVCVLALVTFAAGCQTLRPHSPTEEKEPEDVIDHFLCYNIEAEYKGPEVVLLDQFKLEKKNLQVGDRRLLCNPVDKTTDKHQSTRKFLETHLVCYKIPEDELRRPVTVTNQFKPNVAVPLKIEKAQLLCLPTGKSKDKEKRPEIPTNIDHYKCYAPALENLKTTKVPLKLVDQFGKYEDTKVALSLLCNPVDKTVAKKSASERMSQERESQPQPELVFLHGQAHLVCYRLNIRPDVTETVRIRNQFEDTVVTTKYPELLCLPSTKKE